MEALYLLDMHYNECVSFSTDEDVNMYVLDMHQNECPSFNTNEGLDILIRLASQ